MNDVLMDGGAVGVIVGWVQVVKSMVDDSWNRWLPLLAIILGVIYAVAVNPQKEQPIFAQIGKGVILGFTPAGTFKGVKSIAGVK